MNKENSLFHKLSIPLIYCVVNLIFLGCAWYNFFVFNFKNLDEFEKSLAFETVVFGGTALYCVAAAVAFLRKDLDSRIGALAIVCFIGFVPLVGSLLLWGEFLNLILLLVFSAFFFGTGIFSGVLTNFRKRFNKVIRILFFYIIPVIGGIIGFDVFYSSATMFPFSQNTSTIIVVCCISFVVLLFSNHLNQRLGVWIRRAFLCLASLILASLAWSCVSDMCGNNPGYCRNWMFVQTKNSQNFSNEKPDDIIQ